MIKRRDFIKQSLQATGALALGVAWSSCAQPKKISGTIGTPNYKIGHMLRNFSLPQTNEIIKTDCVVIGGGVSGLAASRKLKQLNIDHVLLELENKAGGNAQAGSTSVGAYPFGAHYVTVPTLHDKEYLDFLQSCKLITSFEKGLPVLNDYHVCFDLKERLYIHGQWQEGLLPLQGLSKQELAGIQRFEEQTHYYKNYTGKDGLPAFTLPLAYSSRDPELLQLDAVSFAAWLQSKNIHGKALYWYLNYCMADDYGGTIDTVSAWAGLHYFASHQAKAFNVDEDAVLTWPEGNNWLVQHLKQQAGATIKTGQLVYQVEEKSNALHLRVFDIEAANWVLYETQHIISCVPQFVNQHMLQGIDRKVNTQAYTYAPWVVANAVVDTDAMHGLGVELAWDNVIYDNDSLGYVHANHQQLAQRSVNGKSNITYYKPLVKQEAKAARESTMKTTYQQWYDTIVADLKIPHPQIESNLHQLDVWLWGHGMIRPSVGFINRPTAKLDKQSYRHRIHFAHTDLVGISVFEEGFYSGTQAALQVLQA